MGDNDNGECHCWCDRTASAFDRHGQKMVDFDVSFNGMVTFEGF